MCDNLPVDRNVNLTKDFMCIRCRYIVTLNSDKDGDTMDDLIMRPTCPNCKSDILFEVQLCGECRLNPISDDPYICDDCFARHAEELGRQFPLINGSGGEL